MKSLATESLYIINLNLIPDVFLIISGIKCHPLATEHCPITAK